ncbi:MAG: TIGR02710 family CRISPR-associated CARF protein, partial [bacterium]|nr:TIGR02710 family CRISPR-associated CARF protein [bacterium]
FKKGGNMGKALIITVGGSDKPLVEAIKQYNPDFIYFICTAGKGPEASSPMVDGDGKVCIEKKEIKCSGCSRIVQEQIARENIIKQAGYEGEYRKIEIDGPDDYEEIYQKTKEAIKEAKQKNYEIIADFTGGTKTMTAVLAMLSVLDVDTKPSLTRGKRTDTSGVTGESLSTLIDVSSVRIENMFTLVDILISHYLYNSAYLLLTQSASKIQVSGKMGNILIDKSSLLLAFSYWDNFEYQKAYENLKDYAPKFKNDFDYLLKILGKEKNSGYEMVFDLIMNAERQAHNGYYDNAVARLYRSLELFAQIRLRNKHNIETSELEKSLQKLKNPEKWEKKKNEKGEIKIGLQDSYEVLLELGDAFGNVYSQQKKELLNILQIRNNSKLAHGDKPVNEEDWKKMLEFAKNFINECCRKSGITVDYHQLPIEI